MNTIITPHKFTGTVKIPASKSHTIRQLLIATLADGESIIKNPLDSLDTRSCIEACKIFGAQITEVYGDDKKLASLRIIGNNNFKYLSNQQFSCCSTEKPTIKTPCNSVTSVVNSSKIDVGNSGTTLYLALAIAGLQSRKIEFTGDESIQKRSAAPLLNALTGLGVQTESNNGCAPISIKGPFSGGMVSLPCPTSQYLTALLIASPLAPAGTVTKIDVPLLNEKPYIEMTLSYLEKYLVSVTHKENQKYIMKTQKGGYYFEIPGGSSWSSFSSIVPGDFSSAAFPAAAAAVTGGPVSLIGLDFKDTQGDKFFFNMLEKMGCSVKIDENDNNGHLVTISRDKPLSGGTFDLNETPDLLPAAAVVAAYAEGDTSLMNVAHARIKETDRIAVISHELAKLGVCCTELPDGVIIHGKGALSPSGNPVIDGHNDHRIVMAFAVSALGSPVPVEITSSECADVTYPGFLSILG
ncbi:MAG: 3-phosphoshikimate 1-carboxyvinyltransferase [Treponema sp.]|nr:3-phosphoshikimate 1-carboxyvinyltransferase [Treponema sp.]